MAELGDGLEINTDAQNMTWCLWAGIDWKEYITSTLKTSVLIASWFPSLIQGAAGPMQSGSNYVRCTFFCTSPQCLKVDLEQHPELYYLQWTSKPCLSFWMYSCHYLPAGLFSQNYGMLSTESLYSCLIFLHRQVKIFAFCSDVWVGISVRVIKCLYNFKFVADGLTQLLLAIALNCCR